MAIYPREDPRTSLPQLEKMLNKKASELDKKIAELDERIDVLDGQIGARYSNSMTLTTHLPANQDSYVEGATITVPKGVYVITVYLSLSTSATGNQSHSVQIYRKSPNAASVQTNRKWTPTNNWSTQELSMIVTATEDDTVFAVRASSSVATSGTSYPYTFIDAVRIK